jgi:glycerol-3-phosphate dehydrogenase
VVWSFSGVRPLFDDGASKAQEATRDYVLKVEGPAGAPALVNVFGGKLTTYRRLAEAVMARIEDRLGRRGQAWTAEAVLPGGDLPGGLDAAIAAFAAEHPWLPERTARRLVELYGSLAAEALGGARDVPGLGRSFGAGIHAAEVGYLMRREWAQTAEDVLWRRTKLGLRVTAEEAAALDDYMAAAGRIAAE